jgi:BioD-like phosphotransacetylase family protein
VTVKSLIVASTREGAGKTSLSIGLAQAVGKRFGYVKPLGDRPLYRKKRLWDYDAALFSKLLQLDQEPENASLGFDHSKLRYMHDRRSVFAALREKLEAAGDQHDVVLIECGKDLSYGASVYLDPLTISHETGHPVVIVAGGPENAIADDLAFVKRFVGTDEANVAGVIINKVVHLDDFRESHLPEIEKLGIEVLGVMPHREEMATRSVSTIADRLFARVLTGENGLGRTIQNVVVGAMSVDAAMSDAAITAPDKLLITSGDRSDMILAAIDAGGTSAIVLTNNIVPPANVVSRATEAGIPLLLVPGDTYAIALQVERIEPLLTASDESKIALLRDLVATHLRVQAIEDLVS